MNILGDAPVFQPRALVRDKASLGPAACKEWNRVLRRCRICFLDAQTVRSQPTSFYGNVVGAVSGLDFGLQSTACSLQPGFAECTTYFGFGALSQTTERSTGRLHADRVTFNAVVQAQLYCRLDSLVLRREWGNGLWGLVLGII